MAVEASSEHKCELYYAQEHISFSNRHFIFYGRYFYRFMQEEISLYNHSTLSDTFDHDQLKDWQIAYKTLLAAHHIAIDPYIYAIQK